MLFNSTVFLIFAAIFFFFWQFVKGRRNAVFFTIIVFSFIFYGWWDWRFLFLLIGSGLIDFTSALLMRRYPAQKHLFLILSIIANVGSLAVFKYGTFIAENLENLLGGLGVSASLASSLPDFVTILPVGISFYTFQSMSYTFDVYREKLEPTPNILHFFAYLSMFPQLVAGPIVRAREILDDLAKPPISTESHRWQGTQLIVTGYFMKIALADNLAPFINSAFSEDIGSRSILYWWCIMLAFSFQIYFDFAGYSRIARGLACWMGYTFPQNFNHPYTATSLQDFWRRWHITLSSWFRDYVYIPLGGSRVKAWRVHVNLWIVMLVSGLWHGASWNFVIWGGVHALFYSFERITDWTKHVKRIPYIGFALPLIITNAVVILAWVFFRSPTTDEAFSIIKSLFNVGRLLEDPTYLGRDFLGMLVWDEVRDFLFWLGIAAVFEYVLFLWESSSATEIGESDIEPKNTSPVFLLKLKTWVSPVAIMTGLAVFAFFFRGPGTDFIYFQF